MRTKSRLTVVPAVALLVLAVGSSTDAGAQWVTTHKQFYLEASHNWQFRELYAGADRLFNAFDFGHAILYETLWTKPDRATQALEQDWFDRLTKKILVRPPRVPLEEAAIEVEYAKLVPEVKAMFEWAHILHRQLYDILADERLTAREKDGEVARVIAYYKTRPDLAFSSRPKSMVLMQEQAYSLAFRRGYPKFNGLIWAYHWLQIGLYEPLLVNSTTEQKQAGVRATVARFWQLIDSVPGTAPHVMPMTPAVSPRFAERYPEAGIIFDNLHSMHDVVSDILANDSVPRNRKRAEILLAARRYRDDTSFVVSPEAWRTMSMHMGLENMGGPAVGFLATLPKPTVAYGAVMRHDSTGAVIGSQPDPHAAHRAAAAAPPQPNPDSAAVVEVARQYAAALVRGDSAAALALLADDAVILESGGVEQREQYRAHHLPADIAFARSVETQRTVQRVVVNGDMAWVASTSTSRGTFRERAVNSAGAELVVLTRAPNGWRISAIHWSSRAQR